VFTSSFKSKGSSSPISTRGGMCGDSCATPCQCLTASPCNVKAFNKYNIYDALAPEFDVYSTIVSLMAP